MPKRIGLSAILLLFLLLRGTASAFASAEYVIVTTNAIRAGSRELENFVQHKIWKGFSVAVITEDDFGALDGPLPNGRAEKIRRWLQDNYLPFGIRYVLLIGNPDPDDPKFSKDVVGDVPMKQIWHALAGGNAPGSAAIVWWGDATDRYYADLDGDWDSDGDGFYGESPWLEPGQEASSPLPAGVSVDGFSARWKGSITLEAPKTVEFALGQWQGARLYVNGTILIDQWPQTMLASEDRRKIDLPEGTSLVDVEYFQDTGHGHLVLKSDGVDMTGFTGYYYSNPLLAGSPAGVITDQTMRFSWETSDHPSLSPGGIGVNFEEEVAVGRIPVYDDDYTRLDLTLRQTMEYEREVPAWRRKVLLPMVPLDASTPLWDLGEAIVDVLPGDFTAFRIYSEDFGLVPPPELTPANPTNMVSGWNQGFGLVTWGTHGHWRWAGSLLDSKYHLSLLSTSARPVTFQASCGTGSIYLPDCYPGCPADFNDPLANERGHSDARIGLTYSLLGEHTIANVAATEVATYHRGAFSPDPLAISDSNQMAYAFSQQVAAEGLALGDALNEVSYTAFAQAGADKYNIYHNELIFNLFGDPSLRLTAEPGNLYPRFPFSSLPLSWTVGQHSSLQLQAEDPEGDPVTYGLGPLPPGATFDPAMGILEWTPAGDQIGEWRLAAWVSDNVNPEVRQYVSLPLTVGPPPFACSFDHGGSHGDLHWRKVAGAWRVRHRRLEAAGDRWNLALVRSTFMPPVARGSFSSRVRLDGTRARANASLVFGYRSRDAYRYATVRRNGVLVGDSGGEATLLPARVRLKRWHDVEVRLLAGTEVEVLLDGASLGRVTFPDSSLGLIGLATRGASSRFDDVAFRSLP